MHAYHELRDLAASKGVRFLHEAAVMGGAPIFSLFREALPAAQLRRFRGILNSTTNLMLTEMDLRGRQLRAGGEPAGRRTAGSVGCRGICRDRPEPRSAWTAGDVARFTGTRGEGQRTGDGADTPEGPAASAGVDYPFKPADVAREGIRGLSAERFKAARMTLAPERKCRCGAAVQVGVPGGEAPRRDGGG